MIAGKPAVFISCSERFRETVADAFKRRLEQFGVHAVIVSEEPRRSGRGWEPENKVESFLRSCEAFVALVTPDDELADGSFTPRPNVVDEVARARSDPRLDRHMIIVKAPSVRPWSNINPTYDRLDIDDLEPAITLTIDQLRAWEIVPTSAAPGGATPVRHAATPDHDEIVVALLSGLDLGDHEKAQRRIYEAFATLARSDQLIVLERLMQRIAIQANDEDSRDLLVTCSVVEAIDRLDPGLLAVQDVEDLARSQNYSVRSSAAQILWQWAEASPGRVPIALLGTLAQPNREDWYVQAPAMAAAKQLMLRRAEACEVFAGLASSENLEDRYACAVALLDVSRVVARAVPRNIVEALAADADLKVSEKAREVLHALIGVTAGEYWDYYRSFGL